MNLTIEQLATVMDALSDASWHVGSGDCFSPKEADNERHRRYIDLAWNIYFETGMTSGEFPQSHPIPEDKVA
jgi:hypothetical protein